MKKVNKIICLFVLNIICFKSFCFADAIYYTSSTLKDGTKYWYQSSCGGNYGGYDKYYNINTTAIFIIILIIMITTIRIIRYKKNQKKGIVENDK